ncbi:MAG: DUF6691 family protein [Novosphingobium sp.]
MPNSSRRLVAGSLLFGVGWGLAGICPGPAVVNLAMVPSEAWPSSCRWSLVWWLRRCGRRRFG